MLDQALSLDESAKIEKNDIAKMDLNVKNLFSLSH